MKATVTLQDKDSMHFVGIPDSGFELTLDADPSVGGANKGPRPLELMAVSLIGCTAMDVISILRKMRQDVTDFSVSMEADRASEHPKVFTKVRIEYVVTGNDVDPKSVARAIELSAERYCPVQAMLEPSVEIEHDFRIEVAS